MRLNANLVLGDGLAESVQIAHTTLRDRVPLDGGAPKQVGVAQNHARRQTAE